jgi:hypothetical protein
MYGKQVNIKTPQKIFRLNEFDIRDNTYPVAQVSIGGEKLDFFPLISPPYLDAEEGNKGPGAFLEIDLAFRNNGPESVTFEYDPSTWKLVTVGTDKLLYINPLVKLADILDSEFKNVNILWGASTKLPTPPQIFNNIPDWFGRNPRQLRHFLLPQDSPGDHAGPHVTADVPGGRGCRGV